MRLVSGKGPLDIESHGDLMNLIARGDLTLQSVDGELRLLARKRVLLGAGDHFIRVDSNDGIRLVSATKLISEGEHIWQGPGGQSFPLPVLPKSVCEECLKIAQAEAAGAVMRTATGGR